MSRDLEVGLIVRMRDQVSTPAQQSERNVQRSVRQTAQTYADASRVSVTTSRMLYDVRMSQSARAEQVVQRNVQQTEATYARANRNILTSSQRLAAARSQLDVRSEQTIRREISQTVAAYNRLYRAGFATANEQARAFAALRTRVAELNRELRGTEQAESRLSRGGRALSAMWRVGGVVAGAAAGMMVAAPAVRETMAYDRRLAMMANTAFSDRDVAGRRRGVGELNDAIVTAVRAGGGTREQAAETLDNLLASGAVSDKTALKMLPTLQKYATATGADPNELGNIAIRSMQNFGIKEEDVPRALDMALKGGQAGGFELKDMSKWLPQQMAMARLAGMSGIQDFGKLVVANQASVITAGTKDEAGNNLVNLLEKLNSQDSQIKAKKLGIDLTGSLSASRAKGVNALDAFVGILENLVSRDKRYQSLKTKLATAPESERKAIMESQIRLLEGTAVGEIIHDRQSLGAAVAYMGQKDYRKRVESQVFDPKMALDSNFETIAGTASFKVEQLKNERAIARQDALEGFDEKLGVVATNLTDYARKYPGLTAAIEGTTLGLQALSAALGVAAAMSILRGGFGAAPAAGIAAADAAAAASAGALGAPAAQAATFGSRFAAGARLIGRFGAPLQAVVGGMEAYSIANNDSMTPDQKKAGYVGVAGGVVGGLGGMALGAAAGAAAGSVVPIAGTAVGAIGGAIAGYFGHDFGERIGKMIGDAIFAQKKDEKPPVVESHVTVNLDGQHLYDFVTASGQKAALRN
ncbi:phage tail tape measure protein [Burkholderia stagnalis]|uniref:phage tail tape measure protein n=1 Tax=Burkholderia stagnalis TaxID=1503054 RepID=UPI000F5D8540|nr:phage tail tape measure protein [Burkholderia stagnalis]RQY36533.1 tail tape measure protein [Burkholderia stagnalis]